MLTHRVRRFVFLHQHQILPLIIGSGATILSLRFTIRACRALSPSESIGDIVAFGILWELAKLYYGPRSVLALIPPKLRKFVAPFGNLVMLALTLVLMAGSIGGSFVGTTEADGSAAAEKHAVSQALVKASPEYQALLTDLSSYSDRIDTLRALARAQATDSQRTKALGTDAKLDALQEKKDVASARLAAMRATTAKATESAQTLSVPSLLFLTRSHFHLIAAVALELIGVMAFVCLHASAALPQTAQTSAGASLTNYGNLVAIRGGKAKTSPAVSASSIESPDKRGAPSDADLFGTPFNPIAKSGHAMPNAMPRRGA